VRNGLWWWRFLLADLTLAEAYASADRDSGELGPWDPDRQ